MNGLLNYFPCGPNSVFVIIYKDKETYRFEKQLSVVNKNALFGDLKTDFSNV